MVDRGLNLPTEKTELVLLTKCEMSEAIPTKAAVKYVMVKLDATFMLHTGARLNTRPIRLQKSL